MPDCCSLARSRPGARRRRDERGRSTGCRHRRCPAARASERGDVVETVILTPVLLLLVFVVVQAALIFHARSVVSAAAQDATRAAQVEDSTGGAGASAAQQILDGSSNLLSDVSITVNRGANEVDTLITAQVTSVVPFWKPTVTGSASGPVERFRTQAER